VNKNSWVWALPLISVATLSMGYAGQARAAADVIAVAEPANGLLTDRFMISLGTFMLNTGTKVELNGSAGNLGTEIDTKKDLGLRDADRFRVDGTWRFKERHKIRFEFFDINHGATKTLSRDITINDTVYPTSVSVTTKLSTTVTALSYEYAFLQRDNYEITGSAGLHAIKFGFNVSGVGSVNGQTAQARTEASSVTAPLPVFGLRGLWQFSPKWYLDGQVQYFAIKIDKIDGRVTNAQLGVTRMFGDHFGVGAGWNTFTTRVGVEKDRFNGSLKWRYSGAQIFVTASF
jgi:hypothetical protein